MAGNRVKTFQCKNCGSPVSHRAPTLTSTIICGSCTSIIDASNENFSIIQRFTKKMKLTPAIPLGTRGNLLGTAFEAIGFMQRRDRSGYRWREYLLFNPAKGFRWLIESDGHWTLVNMIKATPKKADGGGGVYLLTDEREYHQFDSGPVFVDFVLGEFYWEVRINEKVVVTDYICPPFVLSSENVNGEVVWSEGVYLEPHVVREAFKLGVVPPRLGVGINQPYILGDSIGDVKKISYVVLAVMVFIQMLSPDGFFSNFFTTSFLYLILPVGLWIHHDGFEANRWGGQTLVQSLLELGAEDD